MSIYFWDRERERQHECGRKREGDKESKAGSSLWTVITEPNAGLKLMKGEIMTWADVRPLTDWATKDSLRIIQEAHILQKCRWHNLKKLKINIRFQDSWR